MRTPVKPEHIVQSAFQLLDEVGLDGLSLRKVACNLGIRAPSLYWHFKNKQALIDALADALISDVAVHVPEGQPWRATLHQLAGEFRAAFKAHRDGARVYAGTFLATDNVMRVADVTIEAMVGGGASVERAATTAMDLIYYVLGFVIEEQSLQQQGGDLTDFPASFYERIRQRYPHCWAALDTLERTDLDERFRSGIDLLIAGLEQRIREDAPSPA